MSRIDCEEALTHLHDYLKRELTPELVGEVQQHLERCRHCFTHAQFEESFFQKLQTCARHETCPRELRARILAALRAEARGS
ncbi:MAG TPA: zf-HC2 domain-containing protein [Gemmatimonadales bacterium]|nr:zf-HC2 domain-containing protein [Gemmatimonadales bacterium]